MTSRAKVRGVFSAVVFLVLSILLVNPTGTSASFNTTITTPAPTTAVLRGYDVHANLLAAANTSESTGRLTAPLQAPVPRVGRLLPSSAVAAETAGAAESGVARTLTASEQSSVTSLQRNIAEHTEKLEAYRANPDAYDNRGFLKNAPSPEIRQQIIDGRINHLETEIRGWQDQIDKILGGG